MFLVVNPVAVCLGFFLQEGHHHILLVTSKDLPPAPMYLITSISPSCRFSARSSPTLSIWSATKPAPPPMIVLVVSVCQDSLPGRGLNAPKGGLAFRSASVAF